MFLSLWGVMEKEKGEKGTIKFEVNDVIGCGCEAD
jgi:hypothetical protein